MPIENILPDRKRMPWTMEGAALAAGFCASLLLWGCEGSATQTTNGQHLQGTLVDRDGEVVSGATIKAWPDGAIQFGTAGAPAAQAKTDAEGRYVLSDLEAGRYNVFGEAGEGASSVLIPRVRYQGGELDLGVDTLKPPGIIVGSVMTGDNPLKGVFCYVPGSSYVAMTDSLGEFILDRIPEGTYTLKYTSEGYGTEADSNVEVLSGEIKELPVRILDLDFALQPPTPEGLEAVWDSAKGVINVRWDSVQVPDLAGYEIERSAVGPDAALLPDGFYGTGEFVTTNSWKDAVPQRFFEQSWDWQNQDTGTISYRVRAVDKEGNRSRAFSLPRSVFLKRIDLQRTVLSLSETGGVHDSARCRDTLAFVASFTNPVANVGFFHFRVVGWFGGDAQEKEIWASKDPAMNVASDTLAWYLGAPIVYGIGNSIPAPDYGEPDSLRVTATLGISAGGWYSGSVKSAMDIRVQDGCYLVRESRLLSPEEF